MFIEPKDSFIPLKKRDFSFFSEIIVFLKDKKGVEPSLFYYGDFFVKVETVIPYSFILGLARFINRYRKSQERGRTATYLFYI